MAKISWTEITKEDVIRAVEKFLRHNPEYPEPRSTFLVYEDKKLPAKHIRGMAYEEHFGTSISKSEYSGGMETVRFFERLGFEISYSGKAGVPTKPINPKIVKEVEKEMVKEEPEAITISPVTEEQLIKEMPTPVKSISEEKISIPSKRVIEQKNALQLILNKMFNGDIVCEKTYDWLKTPASIEGEYKGLYDALSGYRGDTAFAKKNVVLRCDFVCESEELIIEYDERQHFSEARKVSLLSYTDVPVCFDRDKWIRACRDIQAKDNAPKNRDEVRAYYDSTRDIECARHGYRLVRIMHGQIDFEKDGATEELRKLIPDKAKSSAPRNESDKESLKVCMYLQTDELKNKEAYDKAMAIVRDSDVDLIVFPEFCYAPGMPNPKEIDMASNDDIDRMYDFCIDISRELKRAVVISTFDKYGSIYSVYANAFAKGDETEAQFYMKHTMTQYSALEFDNYTEIVNAGMFNAITYKGFRIGMSICYDCNHSIFSRMYALNGGVDLIVNSTGGNVVYDKWYKYNKVRAIENGCYNLVTMGGNGMVDKPKNYVYGFNSMGGELNPINLNGASDISNVPGGLYVYEVLKEPGNPKEDDSNIFETKNKYSQLDIEIGESNAIIEKSDKITDGIFRYNNGADNVILCIVEGMYILKPEKVLPLLYAEELKKIPNKRYVIINRHESIDEEVFRNKLSIVLKVRAMENFCAVLLESKNINKCYQAGKNKTAQVVKAEGGRYGIDLTRTTGPEAIWKNKGDMKASWRTNFEWLIDYAHELGD